MGTHFDRGRLLFDQERHDLAIREFELELAENPDQAHVHALLALSRRSKKEFPRAREHAQRAIELAPDASFVHYVMAQVELGERRLDAALGALDEALRLDPDDADSHALRGAVLLDKGRRQEALAAAEKALELDAEHSLGANIRAGALVALGRSQEARVGLDDALERRPEDPTTHANQGWTLLHSGQHQRALEHFGEALRLDPTDGWAKEGMLAALKARYAVYRWILAFYLWQARLSQGLRWALVLGLYFGMRALNGAADETPALRPFVLPLAITYGTFVFLTWTADALFDVAILLNRHAKHLLTPAARRTSSIVLCVLGVAALIGGFAAATGSVTFGAAAGGLAVTILPISIAGTRRAGWPRIVMASYCVLLVGWISLAVFVDLFASVPRASAGPFWAGVIGVAVSTWIGTFLPRADPRPDE
ncbi:MAG: tetratricopeptide repeat protein [Planctomycetes bacterium]|nr:tetratricopeptide repeat protein [Planctomycetota bacterium]